MIDIQAYSLEFLSKLSKEFGDEALKSYGEIVEAMEAMPESKLHEQNIDLYLLYELQKRSKNFSQKMDLFMSDEKIPAELESLKSFWNRLPHRLVVSYLPIVKQVAATYHEVKEVDNDHSFADLISVGEEALYLGAKKYFESEKTEDFRSYIWDFLRKKMKQEMVANHPVPHGIRRKVQKLADLRETIRLAGEDFDDDRLMAELDVGPHEFAELLETEAIWAGGFDFADDVEVEELDSIDPSPNALAILLQIESEDLLNSALRQLDDRERQIIHALYYDEQSLKQTVQNLEMSPSVGKKLHKRALRKMADFVTDFDESGT